MANKETKIAIVYDFDWTLSSSEMQDSFIKSLGIKPKEFWAENNQLAQDQGMDRILTYLYLMKERAAELGGSLDGDTLRSFGSEIRFYKGVETWFDSIGKVADECNVTIEHYVVSSGLKEIIEGTSIAKRFKEIYACEYLYDEDGNPVWVKNVVNYTSKTHFLFCISKGTLDIWNDGRVHEYVQRDDRPIPFENMIYIGDGDTDIPCMKTVKKYGGYSIAVYHDNRKKENVQRMMYDGRITHYCKADYSEGSDLFTLMSQIIQKISVNAHLDCLTSNQFKESSKRFGDSD